MGTLTQVFFDPSIRGHPLIEPTLYLGRHVSRVFTEPLPEQQRPYEILKRTVILIASLIALVVTSAFALVGLAVKYFQPTPPVLVPPPVAPPLPLNAATEAMQELRDLYNGLRDLSGREAQTLFQKITEFQDRFDQYRSPDVNDLTKIFNVVDEIVANIGGMQIALRCWNDFYLQRSDPEGVIPQPKDGNCWLHTCILGLRHLNHPGLVDYTYLTLRPDVIRWVQEHYETDAALQGYVRDAIEAHKFVEDQHLGEQIDSLSVALKENFIDASERPGAERQLEQYAKAREGLHRFTLDDYYRHMNQVGSHGSAAELYAISRMFQVNVIVWRDLPASREAPHRLTREYDEPFLIPGAEGTINAVLTQEGNHFNYRLP